MFTKLVSFYANAHTRKNQNANQNQTLDQSTSRLVELRMERWATHRIRDTHLRTIQRYKLTTLAREAGAAVAKQQLIQGHGTIFGYIRCPKSGFFLSPLFFTTFDESSRFAYNNSKLTNSQVVTGEKLIINRLMKEKNVEYLNYHGRRKQFKLSVPVRHLWTDEKRREILSSLVARTPAVRLINERGI